MLSPTQAMLHVDLDEWCFFSLCARVVSLIHRFFEEQAGLMRSNVKRILANIMQSVRRRHRDMCNCYRRPDDLASPFSQCIIFGGQNMMIFASGIHSDPLESDFASWENRIVEPTRMVSLAPFHSLPGNARQGTFIQHNLPFIRLECLHMVFCFQASSL